VCAAGIGTTGRNSDGAIVSTPDASRKKTLPSTADALSAQSGLPWTREAVENLTARQVLTTWITDPSRLNRVLEMGEQWTWFQMQTFRLPIQSHNALTAGLRYTRWLSRWRCVSGGRERNPFRLVLWSAESHASGDVHCHALSVCTPLVLPTHCRRCQPILSSYPSDTPDWRVLKESAWRDIGKATFRPYDPTLRFGAEAYVTKYVMKPTCLDWGVLDWEVLSG